MERPLDLLRPLVSSIDKGYRLNYEEECMEDTHSFYERETLLAPGWRRSRCQNRCEDDLQRAVKGGRKGDQVLVYYI